MKLFTGQTCYHKVKVQSGNVLKLLAVFEDVKNRGVSCNSLTKGADISASSSNKYAQCLNYKDEVSFLLYLYFMYSSLLLRIIVNIVKIIVIIFHILNAIR